MAFAKLYDRKTPITAAEILNDRVVPFYDEHGIRLSRVLTDRGTEFCGTQSHEYELYLAVEGHRSQPPQDQEPANQWHLRALPSHGPRRVLPHRLSQEDLSAIDELQTDLDSWLVDYNQRRPHQGRWCFGKTPMQTLLDALPLAKEKITAA